MEFYFILFLLLFIIYYLVNGKINKKLYCIISGGLIFLVFAFRSQKMGMFDVDKNYVPLFLNINSLTFSQIFIKYDSNQLFYCLTRFIRLFTDNVNVWLGILSLPIVISISMVIYKYSKLPWFSFILFFLLGFFNSNVTILKQSIAISCSIFLLLILDSKLKITYKIFLSIIICFISFGFHPSGIIIVMIPLCYFFKIKMSNFKCLLFVICAFIVWNFSKEIIDILYDIITIDDFQRYNDNMGVFNITMLLIHMTIFGFCFLTLKHYQNSNKFSMEQLFLVLLGISLAFYGLTSGFSDLYRTALYFSIFEIIIIPNAICKIKDNGIKIIVLVIIFAFCLWYGMVRGLLEVLPYEFCF